MTDNFLNIDVHILIKHDIDEKLLARCINSLSNQKVNLYLSEHIEGNLFLARLRGIQYNGSAAEWVTWVDPDDYVLEGGFDICRKLISVADVNTTAVYTNHYISRNGELKQTWFNTLADAGTLHQSMQMHHLVVYRKEVIEAEFPYMKYGVTKDKLLFNLACVAGGNVIGTDQSAYVWNKSDSGNHLKYSMNDNPHEWHDRVAHHIALIRKLSR